MRCGFICGAYGVIQAPKLELSDAYCFPLFAILTALHQHQQRLAD